MNSGGFAHKFRGGSNGRVGCGLCYATRARVGCVPRYLGQIGMKRKRLQGQAYIESLIGKKFGLLTVQGFSHHHYYKSGLKRVAVKCTCECGGKKTVLATLLKAGMTRSCGCLLQKPRDLNVKDLVGKRMGNVRVLKYLKHQHRGEHWEHLYQVKCMLCGSERKATRGFLKAQAQRNIIPQTCRCSWR